MTQRALATVALLLLVGAIACTVGRGGTGNGMAADPAAAVAGLLDTDRRFGAAARTLDGVSALAAAFDDDVLLAVQARFAEGRDAAVEALRADPRNAASRLEWSPIRGGISADGEHGFTFGFMTQRIGDSTHTLKYLAYWVKRPVGWRMLTLRRRRAAAGPRSVAPRAPSLPQRLVAPARDSTSDARLRASLGAAEKLFSDSAQVIGLQDAFERFGRADAINLGGADASDFVYGSAAIGRSVGAATAGQPSPVSWAADHAVVVASSGDLGVTFGFIRPNAPDARAPAGGFPFFTIWRRDSPTSPWRYIAE